MTGINRIFLLSAVCLGIVQATGQAPYNYTEVLQKSILFYEAQQSGYLYKNRIPYRGDSALYDRGQRGEDLVGGWYDAGDHVKFGFPMAAATINIAWGIYEYKDVYIETGLLEEALDQIRWPLEYFIKCHTSQNELYYQVGDPSADHGYWGRPEDMTMERPAMKVDEETPGSEVAADTATAMIIGSILFADEDEEFSALLMEHGIELYNFANTYRGNYPGTHYDANDYGDELTLAALWLYIASEDPAYLAEAEQFYIDFNQKKRVYSYSWGSKTPAVQVLLYILTGKSGYRDKFENYVNGWLPEGSLPYTPKGLVYRNEWGPLRYAANTAMIALLGADHDISTDAYRQFAIRQIHYMLGDTGRSYVVGFGENPPQRPHHRSSSCNDAPAPCNWSDHRKPEPNPHILYGALVGGPDINDTYADVRQDYRANEASCDYNAGFQTAIAALLRLERDGYWSPEPDPEIDQ
ncbi:endoglucanase E-4-like [Ptychodera flava]|uniref:endoglucanase E-4-like n=1 Tax=Ptychodera flava TaxID=63121 RepID=UPI003969F45B